MSIKITSPKVILFDCFETIVENDLNGWKSLFAEIIKKNHWDLDPLEFWNLWKKYEVNFREIRTNMEKIEECRQRQINTVKYLDQEVFPRFYDMMPKDTWIIVTADHGELFGEAGYFGHGPIMHEKCFEVPFLEGKLK